MTARVLDWQRVHAIIAEECAGGGLDIVHAFGIDREQPALSALAQLAAPDFGRPRGLGLLVGNTRALWPAFQRELGRDAALRDLPDPLDRYVVGIVERARARLALQSVVRFAHVTRPQPVPIQRIAAEVGLSHLSPSHLSIHPEHGPWIALRAVVLVDVEGPAALGPARDPCSGCAKPCLVALDAAIATTSGDEGRIRIEHDWQKWLAVRDACPEGRGSRYGEDQLRYHYSKDTRWLNPRSG